MAYHTPLTNSQEFTSALLKARELAHNITLSMRQIPGTDPQFEVFPYTYVSFPSLASLAVVSLTPVLRVFLSAESQTCSTSST